MSLGEEGCRPHVALVVEDFHCLHAFGEPHVLGELVEVLVELDVARELEIFVRELLHEVLPLVHGLVDLGWLWLDMNLGGRVASQVLVLHDVVVVVGVPWRLASLDGDARALPLHVGDNVAVLVLELK